MIRLPADILFSEEVEVPFRHVESHRHCLEKERNDLGWMKVQSRHNHRALPYESWDDLMRIHQTVELQFRWCETSQHVLDSLACSAIGNGEDERVEYSFQEKGDETVSDLPSLQRDLEEMLEMLGWHELQKELIERFYNPGEVIRRGIEDVDSPVGVDLFYLETSQMQPLPESQRLEQAIGQRADFGIIYRVVTDGETVRVDVRKPDSYIIGPASRKATMISEVERVPAREIQHLKNSVTANDPRGYSPFLKTNSRTVSAKNISDSGTSMVLARTDHAVVEFLAKAAGKDALDAASGLETAVRKQNVIQKEREDVPAPGTKRITKSDRIELPNLNLNADDIEKMIEMHERRIGRVVNAPDFISVGRSDIGNRATTDNTIKPWLNRIKETQRFVKRADVPMLWRLLQISRGFSDDQIAAFRQRLRIIAQFPDPTRDIDAEHSRTMDLFDREVISKQLVAESSGINFDKEQERRCEELQDDCGVPNVFPGGLDGDTGPDQGVPPDQGRGAA